MDSAPDSSAAVPSAPPANPSAPVITYFDATLPLRPSTEGGLGLKLSPASIPGARIRSFNKVVGDVGSDLNGMLLAGDVITVVHWERGDGTKGLPVNIGGVQDFVVFITAARANEATLLRARFARGSAEPEEDVGPAASAHAARSAQSRVTSNEKTVLIQAIFSKACIEQLRAQVMLLKSIQSGRHVKPELFAAAYEPGVALSSGALLMQGGSFPSRSKAHAAAVRSDRAAPSSFVRRSRGRGRGRSGGRRRDDYDDDDDDDDDDETYWGASGAVTGESRKSGRTRRSRTDVKLEDEDSNDGESSDGDDPTAPRLPRRGGRGRGRPRNRGSRNRDSDSGSDRAEKGGVGQIGSLGEVGALDWKIDQILAVRFANLPDPLEEEEGEGAMADGDAGEGIGAAEKDHEAAARARAAVLRQAALRVAMPPLRRYEWSTLEFLVKWRGLSMRHAEWCAQSVFNEAGPWAVKRAKNFLLTQAAEEQLAVDEARLNAGAEPPMPESFIEEDWLELERVICERIVSQPPAEATEFDIASKAAFAIASEAAKARGAVFLASDGTEIQTKETASVVLCKWRGLPYSEATWEWASEIDDDKALAACRQRELDPPPRTERDVGSGADVRPPPSSWAPFKESPLYRGNRELRSYQLEGVNWLLYNWHQRRNCVLADEMGLGKTVQAVATLEAMRTTQKVRGPFLVIAPLSTLPHWKACFENWTEMNSVYYHDSGFGVGANARDLIRRREWYTNRGEVKFEAMLTSFNIFTADLPEFANIKWRYVIVDEAHALKNRDGLLRGALGALHRDATLLLTGTPLQNDVYELHSLLDALGDGTFGSVQEFAKMHGDLQTGEQVNALQARLAPYMLRRVKEDVEKAIPPKEETIVEVEMTRMQKAYYRAVFERNRTFLSRGAGSSQPMALHNIEMELRKCCNHPFLLTNVAERELSHVPPHDEAARVAIIAAASGKMVLLDKLLPKLKEEGHRVLLFSQFNNMLTLLSDLLSARGYSHERLDGSLRGNTRAAAIERFNKPGSNIFAFLLSTKAGGIGINLTAADTVIIVDSDWNPQNDMQALARAHRIGQTKEVRVYRLITARSYEAEMFRRASLKLGLSTALLEGSFGSPKGEATAGEDSAQISSLLALDHSKIEALLRFGAYAVMDDVGEGKESAADRFTSSSIDDILASSITMRISGSAAVDAAVASKESGGAGAGGAEATATSASGLSFSKATFVPEGGTAALDVSDPAFWEKVLGPRPGDALLLALKSGILKRGETHIAQWVADATAVLDDVYATKDTLDAAPHEATRASLEFLNELLTLGVRIVHPLKLRSRTSLPFPSPTPAVVRRTLLAAPLLSPSRASS